MSGGSKKAAAALAALLLALAFAACGGGDSGSTTTTGGEVKSPSQSGPSGSAESSGSPTVRIPKHHHDSGGGSPQYRVKGGDNSIPNFGSEADAAAFDEVAAALHGFLDARALGRWDKACSYLSRRMVDSFHQIAKEAQKVRDPSCGGILAALTNPAAKRELIAEAASADVGSVRVEGERGFVIYDSRDLSGLAIPAIEEGGVWKVDGIAPVQIG